MPIEISMPRLSDTMEEGTLIKWRVKVGDKIKSGDLLADVETDKATMELQSYDDGTVARLAIGEGEATPIGTTILLLAEEGESIDDVVRTAGSSTEIVTAETASAVGQTMSVAAPPRKLVTEQIGSSARLRISPVARKIAEEHGVDLNAIQGSGPAGRIVKRDVQDALDGRGSVSSATDVVASAVVSSPPGAAMQTKTMPLSSMRKTIARRLVESKTTIPHFTVTMTIRMDPLLDLRQSLNTQLNDEGVRLSVNDFVVRACALALAKHPSVNSSWSDEGIQQHGSVNVGIAIAVGEDKGGGLVVATIRDAGVRSIREINAQTQLLARKARSEGLTIEDMSDGTFTVSNLGMFGVEHFEAIINPPQAAILAVGAAIERPIVREGGVAVGWEMAATLSADHRIVDGAKAAEFLQTLRQLLENPATVII